MRQLATKTILSAAFALILLSCNDSKDKSKSKDAPGDTAISKIPPPPPSTNPPGVEMKEADKKCFASDGLKYNTVVNLSMGETDFVGTFTSEELESGKKETADFTGTISGREMIVKFKGNPPVVGAASEWTDKPWKIETKNGKENLLIIFNAKNYETNKWQEMQYEFIPCNK